MFITKNNSSKTKMAVQTIINEIELNTKILLKRKPNEIIQLTTFGQNLLYGHGIDKLWVRWFYLLFFSILLLYM